MVKIFLRKKITSRIAEGHLWIYENEIGDISGPLSDGDEVSVYTSSGSFLGKGWYHSKAAIRVRIFTKQANIQLDVRFFEEKCGQAFALRDHIPSEVKRLFHAEADGLSGLYIDLWSNKILVTTTVAALDQRFELIQEAIKNVLTEPYQILKDDSHPLRRYEQLPILPPPEFPPFDLVENGTVFSLRSVKDYSRDRTLIRRLLAPFFKEKIVWDLFCGNANFAQTAIQQGASRVLAVDNEANVFPETKQASLILIQDNVFDFLKKNTEQEKPDLLILDMPAFSMDAALQPYKELGIQALKQLKANGLLVLGFNSSKITTVQIMDLIKYWSIALTVDLPIIWECYAGEEFPRHVHYPHTSIPRFVVLRKNP